MTNTASHNAPQATFVSASSSEIILHVYTLSPPPPTPSSSLFDKFGSFFHSKIMTPTGFGTYHTSIDVNGFNYTFAAAAGIIKTKATDPTSPSSISSCPDGCTFTTSIILGPSPSASTVQKLLQNLLKTFTPISYHLLNRNCNHFTETFSTSLIPSSAFPLPSYPRYINRAAKTGTIFINHGDVCDIEVEGYNAAGREGLSKEEKVKKGKKKELTEKQKEALAKLKK